MSTFTSQDFGAFADALADQDEGRHRDRLLVLLGCSGAVVTSQTLYAAIAGAMREYAVLRALGIRPAAHGRRGHGSIVLGRSVGNRDRSARGVWPGQPGRAAGAKVLLQAWLVGSVAGITLVMALVSGLVRFAAGSRETGESLR